MKERSYGRVVVKIGSNVLSREDGTLDVTRMSSLVDQIAALHRAGTEFIVVSSGAVASGRGELGPRAGRLDTVSSRQLFSAVGQAKLINRYYDMFRDWGITCGQVLTTKESLSTRGHYLNQKNCMEVMLRCGVIPVVNENDTISLTGLMFTDNDELSGIIAAMMDAAALVILTNVDGVYDGDPSAPGCSLIRDVRPGEGEMAAVIAPSRSQFGRGGMLTKSRTARKVAGEGIPVVIANGKREGIIGAVLEGADVPCTRFHPAEKKLSGVKKWIAHSDGFSKGAIHINEGAYQALRCPAATSLLPVGVTRVDGEFDRDEIVDIVAPDGRTIGVGRIALPSAEAKESAGRKGGKPFIHYDYMFLEPEVQAGDRDPNICR
ncbi:MAG: glutamate 5-kinase [Rikenellaceae bacterium]|nr:glutamate 5-kinase [Rikenellaceae bacterium]